ncbi:hypothetical protein [Azospirillum largimobile]
MTRSSRPFNPWRYELPSEEHDPQYSLEGFESTVAVYKCQEKLVSDILRGSNRPTAILRGHLSTCNPPIAPCSSAACPVCLRRMRRWWGGAGIALLQQLRWRPGMGVTATLVPPIRFDADSLHTFDIQRVSARISKQLSRSPLADQIMLGGWDFSFNRHKDGRWDPFWQPHLYVLLPQAADRKMVKGILSDLFPSTETAPKPVMVKSLVKHPLSPLTYSYKATFEHRSGYVDDDGRDNTSHYPLREAQQRELRLFLHSIGFTGRLFLRNVRRRADRLVPEAEQPSCQRDSSPKHGEITPRRRNPF